jgi:hypothetical protein
MSCLEGMKKRMSLIMMRIKYALSRRYTKEALFSSDPEVAQEAMDEEEARIIFEDMLIKRDGKLMEIQKHRFRMK